MLNLISQEQPAQVFVRTLSEAINSGACRLPNIRSGAFSRDENVVGFRDYHDDRYVYVFPRMAIALVRTEVHRLGQHFDWTPNSLSKALETARVLVTKASGHDSAIRKRVGSKVHRVWRLRAKPFGLGEQENDI
jgi:hypothetical protein